MTAAPRSRRARRSASLSALAFLLAATLAGCSSSGEGERVDTADDFSSADTSVSTTASSTTVAPSTSEAVPVEPVHLSRDYIRVADDGTDRQLTTEIWLPGSNAELPPEAAPVVLFAHGLGGHPSKFTEIFGQWASAGFAVVAPRFPFSSSDSTADRQVQIADAANQPLDLDAALRQALDEAALADGELSGRLDATRVVVAGLSMGGGTALAVGYGDCCAEVEPVAVMALSPLRFPPVTPDGSAPLYLFHGTADASLPYDGSVELFNEATGAATFVSLIGAGHADPYEDMAGSFDDLAPSLTTQALRVAVGDADPGTLGELVGAAPERTEVFAKI